VSIFQSTLCVARDSVLAEAAQFSLYGADNHYSDVESRNASFFELITYCKSTATCSRIPVYSGPLTYSVRDSDNTSMCAEHSGPIPFPIISPRLAPLSPERIERLPREALNAILANAAVHMAARSPQNCSIEQLALETKVGVLQSMSQMFQNLQKQRPDVLFSCMSLLFALDVSVQPWLICLTFPVVFCLLCIWFSCTLPKSETHTKRSPATTCSLCIVIAPCY
jgi:hypothetical protein